MRIGQPDDSFEQEADRIAEKVMAGELVSPRWSLSNIAINPRLQRKCACAGGAECEECKEQGRIRRKAIGQAETERAPTAVQEVLSSPGRPLDQAVRNQFEPLFGVDFSNVRLHTGEQAAESARAIKALAYTSGNNIVFAQYAPGTESGRKLLAHELAHVFQQQQSPLSFIQRAPAPPAQADWWTAKDIGVKPEVKFWDDMRLFFPKDARKFSGAGMANIPNIDCDDNGLVSIGKGYWDEADPMKRKTSIIPMITKMDVKRYDQARIDDEDLTNEEIVTKLKGLQAVGLQAYIQRLTANSSFINNGQVIAYLNGDDAAKTRIANSAKEKLLDWKFAENRLTDADFRDEKINTRLRGLTTAEKTAKAEKAKEFATKTGEDTAQLQTFLKTQTTTSTPMPAGATASAAGGFTLSQPNVDIIVLPDVSGGRGNETGFKTNLPENFSFRMDQTGRITEFFRQEGRNRVPIDFPARLQITITTRFEDINKADERSAYGKGTTEKDIEWGARTLRFHEGSHGKVFIDVIKSTNVPSLAIGSVKRADIETITNMFTTMGVQSCQLVDQVGTTQDAFLQTPEGRASGIVSCNRQNAPRRR